MNETQFDTGEPLYLRCTAVRVTQYTRTGSLRHEMGLTYTFAEPVTLAFATRAPVPDVLSSATVVRSVEGTPSLAAVMAPSRHPESSNISALAHGLWMYGTYGAAVEGWQHLEDDRWLYWLIPRWIDKGNRDTWTPREPDTYRVFTAGHAHAATEPYRWPDPPPLVNLAEELPGLGTRLYVTDLAAPPPPLGFPPRPEQGARL